MSGSHVAGAAPPRELTSVTDEELMQRVAGADAGALDLLYERHRAMAYALAVRITGDAALSEEVLQEAFLGIWRNASRYAAARASARTWILSIVHHRAIDAVRRRRPASELPDHEAPPPASLVVPDTWEAVAGRLDRAAILGALSTLPDVQREAIELAYFGGFTQQEIAARTDAPLGTVKSRVRLGLLALRRSLTGDATGDATASRDR
ncbi:MAG TPA: sigma-70 family RNA polymerase sigma factor [Candidatus Baltobacteraceae bacterium]|nr:sigma-70 family RNA polymerase sigma factor [Candidatus Baltobacteraceae bacterium]